MPSLIRSVKQTLSDYETELFSLKNKTLTVNRSVCNLDDVISSIKTSSQTQELKATSLDTISNKCEDFIADTAHIDSDVADVVNQRKDDFYNNYYYLKPDCEKNIWEKYIKDNAIAAWDWCKENWKTALKILVVIVLVAVSIVLLCTGVGGIIAAMAWGAIIGAGIGGLSGGIMSAVNGGSFFEGFVDGAFTGAIGGGITSGLTSLIGPATTLLGSIAQGAAIGAVSGGVSNMAVSAISIYLKNGTLSGSLSTILMSGFSGALAGGILGGLMGGLKFKLATAASTSRDAAASRAAELKSTLPKGELPRATSAAVDAKTGTVYYGDSGSVSNNINPALQSRMPPSSLEPWSIGNCAEFNAANNALNAGARLKDLVITTVKVKTGDPFEMCRNCALIFKGIFVTSG
jgi:hypothetical protein